MKRLISKDEQMARPKTSKAATLRQLRRILLVAIILLSSGWSLAGATPFAIEWLSMSTNWMTGYPVPVLLDGTVPNESVFGITGYGRVKVTYDGTLSRTRGQLADAQNNWISYNGDTYAWATFDALTQTNYAPGNSTPVQYTVTYTFLDNPMPAYELVLGVYGLGRLDQLGSSYISTISVANNGTFLGDYDMRYNPSIDRDFGSTAFVLNPSPLLSYSKTPCPNPRYRCRAIRRSTPIWA